MAKKLLFFFKTILFHLIKFSKFVITNKVTVFMDGQITDYQNIIEELKADIFAISYLGIIDRNLLALMAKNIDEKASNTAPTATKKVFKVFIELSQNIALYSAERGVSSDSSNSGEGIIILKEFSDYFLVMTGNMAYKNDIAALTKKIDMINAMDHHQLRDFKRQMRNLKHTDKGRGNIGLIQVALVSGNPIKYKIIPLDDEKSFAIISSKINKK